LKKLIKKNSEKLKNWINLAEKYNLNTYLITSSDSKLVEQQLNNYKLKIPYAFADDIALKMFIRANPGIVFMKDGVIKAKYTINHKADEMKVKEVLN